MEEKRKKMQTVFIVFTGSMMVAHGLRMMVQGLFYPKSYYPALVPTTLDFWFDWFTLSIIGGIIFLWGLTEFYHMKKEQKSHRTKVTDFPGKTPYVRKRIVIKSF